MGSNATVASVLAAASSLLGAVAASQKYIKLPVKAWLVIGGETFDLHEVTMVFSAAVPPTANVSIAVGYNFNGTRVFDSSKISLFADGITGEIYTDFSGATALPGLPLGPTMVFRGQVSAVSPSTSLESGSTFGVQLQHTGYSDLSSGSTMQWGKMLSTGAPGSKQVASNAVRNSKGADLSGHMLATDGVIGVLKQIYKSTMATSSLDVGAAFAACTGAMDLNAAALAALDKLGGSRLRLREELKQPQRMFDYLNTRITSDLYTMSVAEQLQALGQDLFFRCAPHRDGSIEIVPLTTFGVPFATITGEHIFIFSPSYSPNRRVAGVVLLARPSMDSAANNVGGCYVFKSDVAKVGCIQPVDLPSWLAASTCRLPRSPAVAPQTVANKVAGADAAPGVKADVEAAAKTYGDAFAREIARKIRYQDCGASFTTHFRTDIGVLSTVCVKAPVALDQEVTIYGRVDSLTLSISSQSGTALATFNLAYVRSEQTQGSIIADGGDQHPIYQDTWAGSKL